MNWNVKLVIIILLFLSFGCEKEDPTPVPPEITFLDGWFSPDQSFVTVRFEFYDGDGDLGLKQFENLGNQEFNLFVDYYEKQNGIWVLKSPIINFNVSENKFDTTELHLRIPFIENEAKKPLEGETEVKLLFDFNADTFRYELFIVDRALHKSNTIVTSDFIVN
ncbi:MAG: hypothetical protein CVT95_00515 [Bacteroidetes bacterium HGW-Bacteroidetes-12]|nr:MAG: hypothetical protein CVT95_00515 [Bacteroidetes bacterium HGW-Bacteroidetes-12]